MNKLNFTIYTTNNCRRLMNYIHIIKKLKIAIFNCDLTIIDKHIPTEIQQVNQHKYFQCFSEKIIDDFNNFLTCC